LEIKYTKLLGIRAHGQCVVCCAFWLNGMIIYSFDVVGI
jgi:hypothetical protein